jgi:ATP-binding cassette subfamily C (CFTR/MRP) protein 1
VRSASEVEQNIVSVERVLHQTEVEPEAPQEIPETKPAGIWPSEGAIEFRYVSNHLLVFTIFFLTYHCRNYSTQYRPGLDLILKDINLQIVSSFNIH